jgi:hypothetical protein
MLHERIETYESLKDKLEALSTHTYKAGKDYKQEYGYSGFVNKPRYKALWNDKAAPAPDKRFASSKTCHVCGYGKRDVLLQARRWACPQSGTRYNSDTNVETNLRNFGKHIPVRRGELTSVDTAALALGDKSEPVVNIPVTGRSRSLVEQAVQAINP